jgi:hypothetical protein
VSVRRQELRQLLVDQYRSFGWKVVDESDGTLRATGLNDVTWIGLAVVEEDLDDPGFADRLMALSRERMPQGELCPLELLPDEQCNTALRQLLDRLRLRESGHVEVYSLAA